MGCRERQRTPSGCQPAGRRTDRVRRTETRAANGNTCGVRGGVRRTETRAACGATRGEQKHVRRAACGERQRRRRAGRRAANGDCRAGRAALGVRRGVRGAARLDSLGSPPPAGRHAAPLTHPAAQHPARRTRFGSPHVAPHAARVPVRRTTPRTPHVFLVAAQHPARRTCFCSPHNTPHAARVPFAARARRARRYCAASPSRYVYPSSPAT